MGEVRLNIMMPSYSAYYYSISHNKDRTVSRPTYSCCGVPHTWKDHFHIETGPCFVIDTSLPRNNIETFWDILLKWRHNARDGASNHRRINYLLSRLYRRWAKNISKASRDWPLWGEYTGDRGKCLNSMTSACLNWRYIYANLTGNRGGGGGGNMQNIHN